MSSCNLTTYNSGLKRVSVAVMHFFSLRIVIDYFRERGSTVYTSALDVSKTFDNVNH